MVRLSIVTCMQKYLEITTKWLQIQKQSGIKFYIELILWIMFIQPFMATFLQKYFYVYGSISIKQNVRQSISLKPIWGIQYKIWDTNIVFSEIDAPADIWYKHIKDYICAVDGEYTKRTPKNALIQISIDSKYGLFGNTPNKISETLIKYLEIDVD